MNDTTDTDDDMNCGLTMEERDWLRRGLRESPDTMPPRAVWERIERQARAEGLIHRRPVSERARWLAGSGIAAAVVLAVLNMPLGVPPAVDVTAGGDASLPTVPAYDPAADALQYESINALMVQSQLLERDLRRLPSQPEIGRAGTLATIDDLQSRIAAIDYRLNDPAARLTPEQQEAFWRERVRLMDSLLRMRYAQTQRVSF
jgi:hypothetical protein